MNEEKKPENITSKENENTSNEHRPRRGLEDWEMLQTKEEAPLKVPYWFITLIIALLIGAVLLTLPLSGVRDGYERPWLDMGILVGIGYGIASLIVIYIFMRKRKNKDKQSTPADKSNINK